MRNSLVAWVVGVALLLAGCGNKQQTATSAPLTPVRVQTASAGPSSPAIETNGVVATKDEMRLSFKVAGIVKAVYVEEGQAVKQGQKLAAIELTEIDAQVAQARALQEKSQRDLARGEKLYADEVISLEQLQDLRTQASVNQAQLTGTQFNRGYSVIRAAKDGVVLRKLAQAGELAAAGQPVLVIGGKSRGYVVRAALSDREIVQLKLGDRAEIRMDAFPDRAVSGTVTQIANAADEKTGMFPVEVRFESVPSAIASGLVAKIRVHPASSQVSRLTYVPVSAIVEGDGNRASVFVVDGDHVKRRDVHVAFIEATGVALSQGLKPGERIVTDGALYLQDNDRITVVQDATKVVGPLAVDAG